MKTEEISLERVARRDEPQRVPRMLGEPGLYVVDGSWGTLQPMELAPGVRTIGELEVIGQIRNGGQVIDTRSPEAHAATTIPTAYSLPHAEAAERAGELDPSVPAVLFCNGPLCSATPKSVRTLLECGHPAVAILYYRGGLHDWITVGLPVERAAG
jgi:rhodanese-related sulfurtransferase